MDGTASNNVNIKAILIIAASGTTAMAPTAMQYESYADQLPGSVADYQPIPSNPWEESPFLSEVSNQDNLEDTIIGFSGKLLSNTEDILEVVNENFWDLL